MQSRLAVMSTVLILVIAACAAEEPAPDLTTPDPTTPTGSPDDADPTPEDVSRDPLEPLPDRGELVEVRFAQSVSAASFAALYVARELNFFGYHGVRLSDITLESNVTALQAVIGGSLELTAASATDVLNAQEGDLLAIQNFYMATLQVCVESDWAEAQGVTASSSLEDRMAALNGATIGISGPAALSDLLMRYLLIEYGNLDPNTDAELVQIGGPPALASALDANQIQAFLFSPPTCGSTENGIVLVQPNEVAELQNFLVGTVYGQRSWIEANPDTARAVATALSMGNNFVLQYPEEALEILREPFSQVDADVLEDGFTNTILPQIRENGVMDEAMWETTASILVQLGGLSEVPDTAEGVLWTNAYIDDPTLPD